MPNTNKRYSPKLKFQAVVEVLSGRDAAETGRAYGIHPTSISYWKRTFMSKGPEIFSRESTVNQYEQKLAEMERLLGKKEVEIAFLKNFLH
ncbi:MAG: transposase [Patescibacteria group bacterium]|nr:transposase [Patescibacteria group bacterium]